MEQIIDELIKIIAIFLDLIDFRKKLTIQQLDNRQNREYNRQIPKNNRQFCRDNRNSKIFYL